MTARVGEELLPESDEEEGLVDESQLDETVPVERYDITSYGADYDVEGLVKRLRRGDIFIPDFQREYVWNPKQASRFVESLLLGLPVPGVFLAKEPDTNKLLVIDGQQRLRTLQFFFDGYFNPDPEDKSKRVFRLTGVQPELRDRTYDTLEESDRVKLNDSIIHATVVKQEDPAGDDTSIYYIFERLNYLGRPLTPQEIRVAIYNGALIDRVRHLNDNPTWRKIYGRKSRRLKDQELILRFLALYYDRQRYQRPMQEFLNKFAARNRKPPAEFLASAERGFDSAIETLWSAVGDKVFRPERPFNAAVFDSMMVGIADRISRGPIESTEKVREAYERLMRDSEYLEAVSRSTADEKFLVRRVQKAVGEFSRLP